MPHPILTDSRESRDINRCLQQSQEPIFANNRDWVRDMLDKQPEFLNNLSAGQSPDYLWIGCCDSRVPAEAITGLQPGSMFVHRNIANIVSSFDLNTTSVLSYAVDYLQIKHIIVCGHYGCGGIRAALAPDNTGPLTQWLQSVRDVYYQHKEELDWIEGSSEKFNRLAELNVLQQCRNVMKIVDRNQLSRMQRSYVVHGWIFSLEDGLLRDLDFQGNSQSVQKMLEKRIRVDQKQ